MKYRTGLRAVCLGCLGLLAAGCADQPIARYVYQDGEFGVVAIPINTYHDRTAFRVQAEKLMERHFPEGYEIVRAEEVNEGDRIIDLGKKTDLQTEPTLSALSQVIKVGKLNRTTSFEEKDTLKVRESRIIYRRKPIRGWIGESQFAPLASLSPPLYIDPNEPMRSKPGATQVAKADPDAKKPVDPSLRKASDHPPKPPAPDPPKPAH